MPSAFLLKPNNSKVSSVFKFCVLELLTNLNKSASKNIIFLFTNPRGTFFKPGNASPALRALLNQINSAEMNIPLTQSDTFFVDNEAFRFLVAKSPPNNVRFSDEDASELG
ncbi:hypothetical protein BV898_01016 [Hypsibius exemplaris]|uniref:Uncharacterized protein n=1 Tax=Hypsibius exemplaris TaxID=2072580 RepID=A0A1W0XCX3_HYPEX|nr:hypothetical protein BV898_01016 [Hypsibius exemplaris]